MLAAQRGQLQRAGVVVPAANRRSGLPLRRRVSANSIQCSAASAAWPDHIANVVRQQPALQLAVSVVAVCQRVIRTARDSFEAAFPKLQNVDSEVRHCLLGSMAHRWGVEAAMAAPPSCDARWCVQRIAPHAHPAAAQSSLALFSTAPLFTFDCEYPQALKAQLSQLSRNMRLMALFVLPLARASTESLTAVYARTFEKAAFGFAKVCGRGVWEGEGGNVAGPGTCGRPDNASRHAAGPSLASARGVDAVAAASSAPLELHC